LTGEQDCKRVEDQLDGYILGELSTQDKRLVDEHLETCDTCREKVALIASAARAAREQERAGLGYHLPAETIVDLAMDPDSVTPEERTEALEHLRLCEDCTKYYKIALEIAAEPVRTVAQETPGREPEGFWNQLRALFGRRWVPAWAAVALVIAVAVLLYKWEPGPRVDTGLEVAERIPEEVVQPIEEIEESPEAEAPGPDRTWRSLVAEAEIAASEGDDPRALALADSAWAVGSSMYDETSPDYYSVSWRDSSSRPVYFASYAEGESLIVRVLGVEGKVLGPDHPDIALGLDDLAVLLERELRHRETVPLRERALAIREASLDPLDPWLARSVMVLANHYNHLGRYAEAEPLYRRALDLREQIYGPDIAKSYEAARMVAHAHDNLGHFYLGQGRYIDAETEYLAALAVREIGYPPDHHDFGANLSYLARVNWALGDIEEAEDLYRQGLDLRERGLGPDHPDVATSLSSLAMIYTVQGRYEEAEPLYRRALTIRREYLKKEHSPPAHPGIAMALHSLASLYTEQGRYADAEPLYEEAIDVWNEYFGFEHPRSVGTVSDFAYDLLKMDRPREAAALYAKALDLTEQAYGNSHPRIAGILESECLLYRLEGRAEEALALAERAVRIRRANFRENAVVLAEADALSFSHSLRRSLANYLSSYIDAGAPESQAGKAADIIFANKGPVSDEIFERQQAFVAENDPQAQALAVSLKDVKFQLAQAYMAGPGRNVEGYTGRVDSLQGLASDLEAQLARASSSFRERHQRGEVNSGELAALLPGGAVLVEYLRFDYIDPGTEERIPRYAAVVLGDGGRPKFLDLGETAGIDQNIDDYADHMASLGLMDRPPSASDEVRYARISESIYSRVWQPVENVIGDAEMVLISPDGALSLLAFGSLKTSHDTYLVESVRFHYLTAGRDLARMTREVEPGRGLLAMGDPDYGGAVDEAPRYAQRGVLPTCDEFEELWFRRLPGFRVEIEAVEAAWLGQVQEPVLTYLGADATEEAIKARAPGSRVIHLATHGYFLGSDCGTVSRPGFGIQDTYYAAANPLLLSGLALAGANLTIAGGEEPDGEDGILTAYEVSALDLSGTRLVVLSACETARGEVEEGEGTYGLRRAFHAAGARTVVSTLWKIPDQTTSEMMGELYSDPGRPAAEALRAIQIDRIRTLRASGQSDHPYSWGAFMATGDWR